MVLAVLLNRLQGSEKLAAETTEALAKPSYMFIPGEGGVVERRSILDCELLRVDCCML